MNPLKDRKIKVLVVEDELSFQLSIRNVLRSKKEYEVETCQTGREATALLESKSYDVILLDHQLPDITGLNVLQWMYEQKMDTPVVMLTGAGNETVAVEAMKLGAYDYIRKEHLDLAHLPVVIYSTFERYLFKKEKEELETVVQDSQTYRNTLLALARYIGNTNSLYSILLDRYHESVQKAAGSKADEELESRYRELKNEIKNISSAIQSMINLMSSLQEKIKIEGTSSGTPPA